MKNTLLFCLIFAANNIFAQIQKKSIPYLIYNNSKNIVFDDFVYTNFNPQNYQIYDNNYKKKPFAVDFDVDISFNNSFFIEKDDEFIFFKRIIVPNSKGLSLIINDIDTNYKEFFLISGNKKNYSSGIDNKFNSFEMLQTYLFSSDTLIIELHTKSINYVKSFKILKLIIAYNSIFDSQECEVDINCENSEIWQKIKHSVVKYTFKDEFNGQWYLCTGEFIANSSLDNTPYLITANHCIDNNNEAKSMQIYFNYEKQNCNGVLIPVIQTITGASLIATASTKLDFSLLKLNTLPPIEFNPYFVGWDRRSSYTDTSTCIHHPNGDVKKISKSFSNLGIGSFTGYDNNKHWHVKQWNLGTTEGGSSGSGLYTKEGLLIGVLSGGDASCTYNVNDFFQQFFHCWNDYTSKYQQLKYWLDSLDINPSKLEGYYAYENIDLPIVRNVSANIQDSLVFINWENVVPLPDKYILYKNLKPIFETINDTNYIDTLHNAGVYSYFVRAVFDSRFSKASNNARFLYGDTTILPIVSELIIYPQPTADILKFISSTDDEIEKIEIRDIFGRLVFNCQYQQSNFVALNIDYFAVGCYFATVKTKNKIYTKKIVKWIDK